MPILFSGSIPKEMPMLRSRMRWTVRLLALLLGHIVAGPLLPAAEAASSSSTASAATRRVVKRTSTKRARSTLTKRRYSSSRSRTRRARLARAKAAAFARDLRELQTPRFKTGVGGELVPDIRAEAAIIYNPVTQEVLWEENSQNARSIASITKVMTAVVFLENATDLVQDVAIDPSDVRAASTTYLKAREHVTSSDLLNLLLIGSDNAAARALARVSPLGSAGFIDRMNTKAQELGLQSTHYADPSGLSPANVSSAYDMARLISFASGDERIAGIMRKSEETLVTSRRMIKVRNTNKLIGGDVQVRGGKTGFIRQAGYCLATLLQMPQGDPVAVVVLGARSNAGRFMETKHLFNWLAVRTKSLLVPETPQTPVQQPQ
jgi:serine-type D-Ala-D-Ala endopeptidase (penicillin-binding protein 7)